jgi:hypothetical protein
LISNIHQPRSGINGARCADNQENRGAAKLLEGKRRQFQIEKKYLRKDGSSIWVRNNVSLVPGTERVPRFIMALAEDITQRKRAEEALQGSEAYLAEAQKLTHAGSWAVRVPQMENAQGEAGQGLAVIPRFGWDASYWSKEMSGSSASILARRPIWRTIAPHARDLRQRGLEWKLKPGGFYQTDRLPDQLFLAAVTLSTSMKHLKVGNNHSGAFRIRARTPPKG